MEQSNFLEQLMVLPVKPEFIGFTIGTDRIFKQMTEIACDIMEHDIEHLCKWGYDDEDYQFHFIIDTEGLYEFLGEEKYNRVYENVPFDMESPWEVAEVLLMKLYQIGTWVYATVRPFDDNITEIQIGIPRNL